MASIELSSGIMCNLPSRVIYPTSSYSCVCGCASSGAQNNTIPLMPLCFSTANTCSLDSSLQIYQGSPPSDLSSLPLSTSRSADTLVKFCNTQSSIFSSTLNVACNPAIINSAYVSATASGTATWFRLYVAYIATGSGGGTCACCIIHQVVGTVGATGSGADLEIPSTAIVSGRAYRIQNLRILFPSSWSY